MDKNQFVSEIYKLKNEKEFIGKWNQVSYFDLCDESLLEKREGCGVFLSKEKNKGFEGLTQDDKCKSTLRGASYATSKVWISQDRIESWDQGFDAKGEQVWGATKGPYIFIKL